MSRRILLVAIVASLVPISSSLAQNTQPNYDRLKKLLDEKFIPQKSPTQTPPTIDRKDFHWIAPQATQPSDRQGSLAFMLTSSSFKDGMMLAVKNAGAEKTNPDCVGQNVSPPFAWSNPPAGTKSYVLTMIDPVGRGELGVVHLLAYNIPVFVTGFAENELSAPSPKYTGGKVTDGQSIYMGPCTPPNTDAHHYTFTLIATDLEPGALPPGLTYPELMDELEGHAKGAADLIGQFKKS